MLHVLFSRGEWLNNENVCVEILGALSPILEVPHQVSDQLSLQVQN